MPRAPLILHLFRFSPARHGFGCDGGGYGCWFYEHSAHTVGAYPVMNVTVARPLLLRDKSELYPWIDETVDDAAVRRVLAPCRADERCGLRHTDIGVCAAALRAGYDSVRMPLLSARTRGVRYNEWVICREGCLTQVWCAACVPVIHGRCATPDCCRNPVPPTRWQEALQCGRAMVERDRARRGAPRAREIARERARAANATTRDRAHRGRAAAPPACARSLGIARRSLTP